MTAEVATIPEIVTLKMHMNEIGYDAPTSSLVLRRLGDAITVINKASTYCRVLLGLQLQEIRDGQLWMQPELWADGQGEPRNWSDWLRNHYAPISGLSVETSYGAMQVSDTKALIEMGEEKLKNHKNLANAILLAKIEKQDPQRARELAETSMDMPIKEFRKIAGVHPDRGNVRVITETPEQADPIILIAERIKGAPAHALETLVQIIEEDVAPIAGDSPGDIVDFLISALREHVISEMGEPQTFYERF